MDCKFKNLRSGVDSVVIAAKSAHQTIRRTDLRTTSIASFGRLCKRIAKNQSGKHANFTFRTRIRKKTPLIAELLHAKGLRFGAGDGIISLFVVTYP